MRQALARIISGRPDESAVGDWDEVVASAESEGVAPLVFAALSGDGRLNALPESARRALRESYSATLMHNERMFKELESLVPLWLRANIPIVLLKGACFSLTIYPDIGLRPMGDLDVLVPASHVQDAVGLARTRGFRETLPEASPGLIDLLSHHVFLERAGPSSIALEIHDALVGTQAFSYAVPVAWFWTQTEALPANSTYRLPEVRMLSPAAQLLYGAAHAMLQHGGREATLRWFYDLHLLVVHYADRMDWKLLLAKASEFEWSSALDAALAETRACFGTPVPEEALGVLSRTDDRHRALVTRRRTEAATHTLEERDKMFALNWYGRLRLALALIAPGPSYMMWRYRLTSRWLLPVYYPLRWWGILRDGLKTLMAATTRT